MIHMGQNMNFFPDQSEALPNASDPSSDWTFWNGAMQGDGGMQGFDGMMPQNFH
jgi:hypothetical protein